MGHGWRSAAAKAPPFMTHPTRRTLGAFLAAAGAVFPAREAPAEDAPWDMVLTSDVMIALRDG